LIYQAIQKLLAGRHTETGDLISLLSFLESRLKTTNKLIGLDEIIPPGLHTHI
jgi:hypothetical protein